MARSWRSPRCSYLLGLLWLHLWVPRLTPVTDEAAV